MSKHLSLKNISRLSQVPSNMAKAGGFSLIEMIIVIFIIGALVTLSLPALRSFQDRNNVRIEAEKFRSTLVEAQNLAFSPQISPTESPTEETQIIYGYGVKITVQGKLHQYTLFKDVVVDEIPNNYIPGIDPEEEIKRNQLEKSQFQEEAVDILVFFTTPLTQELPYIKKTYIYKGSQNQCENSPTYTIGLTSIPPHTTRYSIQINCQTSNITIGD